VTVATTVRAAAARFGPRTALVDPDGTTLSYADLDVRSEEVAAGLRLGGVEAGDVVLLRLPSVSAYVIAYAAAAKVGAITAGVNPRLAAPEQEALAALAGAALTLDTADDVEALRRPGKTVPALSDDPSRPVTLVFTSGTTGQPKGALFLERQLAAVTTIDVADAWGDPSAQAPPMLASTQFAHVGFMTKLPWYLRLGTTTHILSRWRAADVLACVVEQRMPTLGAVAPQVALLLREDLEAHDLSHLQAVIAGGAPSPPALVREARHRLAPGYSIRYSSTESGGCGTGTALDADEEEQQTVGQPRGTVEVEVRGDDRRLLPAGEVGEVWLRSPTVFSGYWHDPETTAEALVDGWLRTGDLGALDGRGNLRLAGRSKEMFIRGGYNDYPAEVESALADHPGVAEVVVVPRPDDVMGEVGVAVVVPVDPAEPPALEDLRAFLAPNLAHFKLPEAMRLVDELPLTPMQKVDRRALAAAESPAGS
jgi:acyl-CoA synthetase (AMP-forming)/AMP-acid ligase II